MDPSDNKTLSKVEYSNSSKNSDNSFSFIQNSENQNLLEQNIENTDNKKIFESELKSNINSKNFFCNKCYSMPLIEYIHDLYITYSCDHIFISNIFPSNFLKYFSNDKDIEKKFGGLIMKKEFRCFKHDQPYAYYDIDCKDNLCEKCISSTNEHKNDTKINFDEYDILFKKKYITNNLETFLKQKYNDIIELETNDDFAQKNSKIPSYESKRISEIIYLNEIIKTILNAYKEFPCYKHYANIENIYKYIKEEEKLTFFKVNNKNELIDKLNDKDYNNILSIIINGQSFDLENTLNEWAENNNFKTVLKFSNLKELNLGKNKIKTIEFLSRLKLPNLQILDLSDNFLGDELNNYIKKLDLPELRDLNLYKNNLENYQIFDKFKHFLNLKILYIGLNKFSKGINRDSIIEETKFDLSSLETIGLTKIWSDEDGVKDLKYFKFKNLQEIYLSGNNINSMDDIVLDCDEHLIKIFWLKNNKLKKFSMLKKYRYLEDLSLKNNLIDDIANLDTFLSNFRYLKKFNIENNLINYNDPKNIKIINDVEKKYKNISKIY